MSITYVRFVERFVAVADAGSIQGAAKKLNLSQPSLTQSIKSVEEAFGCRLFERTKQGVVLTKPGEVLYRRSCKILDESGLARKEISDYLGGLAGSLRITAGTAWGTCILPPLIRGLQSQFPALKIDINLELTPRGVEQLHAGEADLVFGALYDTITLEEGFLKKRVTTFQLKAVCGPDSDLASSDPISIEKLADHPFVNYLDDDEIYGDVIGKLESEHGKELNVAVTTGSLLSAVGLVLEGPYIMFLAEPVLEHFSKLGMRAIKLERELHSFETGMYYRESLRQTKPFRYLMSSLKKSTWHDHLDI